MLNRNDIKFKELNKNETAARPLCYNTHSFRNFCFFFFLSFCILLLWKKRSDEVSHYQNCHDIEISMSCTVCLANVWLIG